MGNLQDTKAFKDKLAEMSHRAYIPARLLALISSTVEAQQALQDKITMRPVKAVATASQHAQGMPLISRNDFLWNKKTTEQLFKKILKAVIIKQEQTTDPISVAALILDGLVRKGELVIQDALKAYVAENAKFFKTFAKQTPTAPDLLLFLSSSTLAPILEKHAEKLAKKHGDKVWSHGHCPICGSLPFMGSLAGKEGNRLHTCSFCKHSYRVPRLGCAFCLNEQPDGTNVYSCDEDKYFQIYTCDKCKNYMKIADFRELDRPFVPSLDDVISLPFDIKARELGFTRPAKSAWGV